MTFAAEVKKECTLIQVHREYAKAELMALIRMNGTVGIQQRQLTLNVQSENAAIARRILTLLKEHYQTDSEVIVRRKMKLKKNNVYIVKCHNNVQEILEDLKILDGLMLESHVSEDIMKEELKVLSYLRGAFLAAGSINDPKSSSYHLEIYSNYEEHNQDICRMMNLFDLNARTIVRRNGYITYLKEAEKISEFLGRIGANSAVLTFEDVRIQRDIVNSANRMLNCEIANVNKVINAAQKQIEAIRKIEAHQGLESLPEKLRVMAQFRLDNPEANLAELSEQIPGGPISKSGINHRLRKLVEMAEKLA